MKYFLLFFTLMNLAAFAQEKNRFVPPDLDKMEKEVNDKKSDHYYPKLWARYQDNDTTISPEDYRYLYYGFSFQKEYNGYAVSDYQDSIRNILRKDTVTDEEFGKLEKYLQAALKDQPFSIRYLDLMTSVYRKLGKADLYRKYKSKLNGVIDAVSSTGDGLSQKTAMYVVTVDDEYEILDAYRLQFGGNQSLLEGPDGPCDELSLAANKYDIKNFYFNVKISMSSLEKMLKDGDKKKKSKKSGDD